MTDTIDIAIDEIFNKNNLISIKKPLATVHIALSSENQEPEFENTPMKWNLNLSNSKILGNIATMAPLSNLYHMKIADFLIFTTLEYSPSEQYDPKSIHFLIEELASQAFIGPPNFHFSGILDKINKGGNTRTRVQFYDYNRGDFYFTRVVEVINSFTLRVYKPFVEITIPRQIRYAYVINNSSPMQIEFSSKHFMPSGYAIKITDLQSNNDTVNKEINGNSFLITSVISDNIIEIDYSPATLYSSSTPVITNFTLFQLNIPIQLDYLYEPAN